MCQFISTLLANLSEQSCSQYCQQESYMEAFGVNVILLCVHLSLCYWKPCTAWSWHQRPSCWVFWDTSDDFCSVVWLMWLLQLQLSDIIFTSESSSCPSIPNAFWLDVAFCPNHHADRNYQSAPLCSDLRNVAKTLLGKPFVSTPFVILQLLPENVFYIFYISLNWKDDNVISLPPMTYLVLIPFRCPTIDNSC